MKKLLLFSALVLASCAGKKDGTYTTSIFNPAPPQTIHNEKCEDVPAVQIFQVLNNFALAYVCKVVSSRDEDEYACHGMTVYVPKGKNELFYDDKIIKPQEGQCISYSGTYKYKSRNGEYHTIPKVQMIDAEVSNPEYEKWEKEQQ